MPQPELLCVNPTTASPLATKHARSRTPSPCAWVPGAENLPAGLSDVARMQQRGIRERPSGRGVCPNIQRCAMNPGFHCISSGAIIHSSDYESTKAAMNAIDRYFKEMNQHLIDNPKRAGNKIWGMERTSSEFSASNNCKDPAYR